MQSHMTTRDDAPPPPVLLDLACSIWAVRTVGVGQDDVGTLSSQLQRDLLQVGAARSLLDQVTHLEADSVSKQLAKFHQQLAGKQLRGGKVFKIFLADKTFRTGDCQLDQINSPQKVPSRGLHPSGTASHQVAACSPTRASA